MASQETCKQLIFLRQHGTLSGCTHHVTSAQYSASLPLLSPVDAIVRNAERKFYVAKVSQSHTGATF